MLKKEEIVVDPDLDKLHPGQLPSKIEITMTNGQVYKGEMYHAKGSPKNPFSTHELYEKFRRLATPAIGAERANQIVEMTEDLESIKNIRTFIRLFA